MSLLTATQTTTIAKILSIVDTRQYEEVGDVWKPIPGSGHENECFRCGRFHKVHATVLLSDGRQVIVGTGCAGQDDPETASKFQSLDRAAKRLARLEAEKTAYDLAYLNWRELYNKLKALPLPEVTNKPAAVSVGARKGEVYGTIYGCQGAWVLVHLGGTFDQERQSCLKDSWIASKIGFQPRPKHQFTREIARLKKRIEALKA